MLLSFMAYLMPLTTAACHSTKFDFFSTSEPFKTHLCFYSARTLFVSVKNGQQNQSEKEWKGAHGIHGSMAMHFASVTRQFIFHFIIVLVHRSMSKVEPSFVELFIADFCGKLHCCRFFSIAPLLSTLQASS